MRAVSGAIVILAGSILAAGAAIAEAIPKISNAIPPSSVRSTAFLGVAIILIGAGVMGTGLRSKPDDGPS